MRKFVCLGFFALGSMTSPGMAQSLHPPVATFPINDAAAQPAAMAPVATPTSVHPVAAPARPIVAAVPAPVVAAPSASAAAAASASRPIATEHVGEVTQQLLAAQAQGVRAGIEQPMLGATATAAWTRYLNSFNHPIPEWFDQTVETK